MENSKDRNWTLVVHYTRSVAFELPYCQYAHWWSEMLQEKWSTGEFAVPIEASEKEISPPLVSLSRTVMLSSEVKLTLERYRHIQSKVTTIIQKVCWEVRKFTFKQPHVVKPEL